MKTCVIVGQNYPDNGLQRIVSEYGRVIIFEPIPSAAAACREACADIPGVIVFQAACGESFATAPFRIYNENGLSSSLGEMTSAAVELYTDYDLSLTGTITVQVVHLGYMLELAGISEIDFLLIDAQGLDFTILKTVERWISESRVNLIQLEADGNGFCHYSGLPDNSEEAILAWMQQYPQYAVGKVDGRMKEQPDLTFELMG